MAGAILLFFRWFFFFSFLRNKNGCFSLRNDFAINNDTHCWLNLATMILTMWANIYEPNFWCMWKTLRIVFIFILFGSQKLSEIRSIYCSKWQLTLSNWHKHIKAKRKKNTPKFSFSIFALSVHGICFMRFHPAKQVSKWFYDVFCYYRINLPNNNNNKRFSWIEMKRR